MPTEPSCRNFPRICSWRASTPWRDGRALLRIASVSGTRSTPTPSRHCPASTRTRSHLLRQARCTRPAPGRGLLEFRHGLLHEAVYDDLMPDERPGPRRPRDDPAGTGRRAEPGCPTQPVSSSTGTPPTISPHPRGLRSRGRRPDDWEPPRRSPTWNGAGRLGPGPGRRSRGRPSTRRARRTPGQAAMDQGDWSGCTAWSVRRSTCSDLTPTRLPLASTPPWASAGCSTATPSTARRRSGWPWSSR
jgi:hypothetical protein